MSQNVFWIVRVNSNNYRTFVKNKDIRPLVETLKLLSVGKSLPEIWEPVFLSLYQGDSVEEGEENERNKPVPDFVRGVLGFSMNEKAFSILDPLIYNQAKFLQLNTEVGLYYELDIQKIKCLDVPKSIVKRLPSGRITRVEKYSFDFYKLAGAHIFCLPELGRNPIFVSNRFKEMVESNNLAGLLFSQVPLN